MVGPNFDVQSTGGVASIYALSATHAEVGGAAASGPLGAGTNAGASASNSANTQSDSSDATATGSQGAESASTDVAGASASGSGSSSGGLSGGAKAGIAIGVLLGIALLLVGAFYLLRTRRRMHAAENELQETKKQHDNERAYVDGILKVAGKPSTHHGGRVVMADAPNRGSGDWKRFFGSKAGSAAGTATPSRLGTAAASPVPPSPRTVGGVSSVGGDAASVRGEGSTVGLVSKSEEKS